MRSSRVNLPIVNVEKKTLHFEVVIATWRLPYLTLSELSVSLPHLPLHYVSTHGHTGHPPQALVALVAFFHLFSFRCKNSRQQPEKLTNLQHAHGGFAHGR
jgi:hypothetical protein